MPVGDYIVEKCEDGTALRGEKHTYSVVLIESEDDSYIVCGDCYKSEAERISDLLNMHGMTRE